MSACQECVHYEVCMDFTDLKKSEIAQSGFQSDVLCEHFEDKNYLFKREEQKLEEVK